MTRFASGPAGLSPHQGTVRGQVGNIPPMVGAVTVSRFEIPQGQEREYEQMLLSFGDEVSDDRGFIATSVWQEVDNPNRFLRLTAFRDFDSLFKSYDEMVQSGFLETAVEKWGIAPDVKRIVPIEKKGDGVEHMRENPFVSVSIRAMEPGQGDPWVQKMKYNFAEIESLPGMQGWFIGRCDELDDEIVGIVGWASEEACRRTIPPHMHYPVTVYRRYR